MTAVILFIPGILLGFTIGATWMWIRNRRPVDTNVAAERAAAAEAAEKLSQILAAEGKPRAARDVADLASEIWRGKHRAYEE